MATLSMKDPRSYWVKNGQAIKSGLDNFGRYQRISQSSLRNYNNFHPIYYFKTNNKRYHYFINFMYGNRKTAPSLPVHHKGFRVEWMKANVTCTGKWTNVPFDEKKFVLNIRDGFQIYWKSWRKMRNCFQDRHLEKDL